MQQQREAHFFIQTEDAALYKRLYSVLMFWRESLCVRCTVSPGESEMPPNSVLFLDVRAPNAPRRLSERCAIVAVGETDEQAFLAYQLHAEAFLSPVFSWSELYAALGRCFDAWQSGLMFLSVRHAPFFPLYLLLYAEADGRSTVLHCRDEVIRLPFYFRTLLNSLPSPPFFQCHRSYAVHIAAVDSMASGQLFLHSGTSIPLSRTRSDALKQEWQSLEQFRRTLCIE